MFKVFRTWMERYFADEEAVLVAVLLVASFAILVTMGVVLAPMITALIIAFLMQGAVLRMKLWGLPHNVAVTVAFLLLVGGLILAFVFILPALWYQSQNLVSETPRMLKEGRDLLLLLPERYPTLVTAIEVENLIELLQTRLGQIGQSILSFSITQIPVLVAVVIYVVLVPILVFFFLKDSEQMLRWFGSMLPRERPVMNQIWKEMNQQIANYVRGKFIEILIVTFVTSITFSLLGLNYALLLGLVVGLSVLIPYIGAVVATLPVAMIAFFQWGWSSDLAYVMVAYAIIQMLDGNLLVPVLFSEAVSLHPVAIIMAVLVFGGLWGFWGVFFAIPLATLFNAVLNAWPTKSSEHDKELDSAE